MRMSRLPRVEWRMQRALPGPAGIALLAGVAITVGALAYCDARMGERLRQREHQLERAMARPLARPMLREHAGAKRSANELRQLHAQIALLNRDWVRLLQEIVPGKGDVKLLGVDVNASTASTRITGRADGPTIANAYAQALQARGNGLHDVRLLLLERKSDGVQFEVSARWAE
jgi:hypothetical protein